MADQAARGAAHTGPTAAQARQLEDLRRRFDKLQRDYRAVKEAHAVLEGIHETLKAEKARLEQKVAGFEVEGRENEQVAEKASVSTLAAAVLVGAMSGLVLGCFVVAGYASNARLVAGYASNARLPAATTDFDPVPVGTFWNFDPRPVATAAAPAAPPQEVTSSTVDVSPVAASEPRMTWQTSQLASFQRGLEDRRTWEAWFNSLSALYQSGVLSWSARRSLPQPGTCFGSDGSWRGDWTAGCLEAQRRLAQSDAYRQQDPNYRAGWDSLGP